MENCLLHIGFPKEIVFSELKLFLEENLKDEKLKDLWMDPYQKARAVALFENISNTRDIQIKIDKGKVFYLEKTNPASSILVQTHGLLKSGAVDKLNLIFSTKSKKNSWGKPGAPCEVRDGVFEIEFKNGWEVVLFVCKEQWKVENIDLDVCPYFDCFKESIDQQIERFKNALELFYTTLQPMTKLEDPTKMKGVKTQEVTFKNTFAAFLLKNLNLESAVRNLQIELKINKQKEAWVFSFTGLRTKVKKICEMMSSLENILEISIEEQHFVQNEVVQHNIKLFLKKVNCHLKLTDNEGNHNVYIENKQGEKIYIKDFLSTILVKTDCSHFLKDTSKTCDELLSVIKHIFDVESSDYPVHAFIENSRVKLLTVAGSDSIISSIFCELEKSINESSNAESNKKNKTEIFMYLQPSTTVKMESIGTSVYKLSEQGCNYSKIFLMDAIKEIASNCNCQSLRLGHDNIQINGAQQNIETALTQINHLIKKICSNIKRIAYPGLSLFMTTKEGLSIVETISKKFKCLIELPKVNLKYSPNLEAVKNETVRPDYRVILLETAKFDGFSVHLAQGKIEDMNMDVTVEFSPTTKQDEVSSFEKGKSLQITLPEWKPSVKKSNKEHFSSLRLSLKKIVNHVLQKAIHAKCTSIGFSTEKIQDAEFAFPLDSIAEILISELMECFRPDETLQRENYTVINIKPVDVYICEPKYNAVFKAFTYYCKKYNGIIENPDEASWDSICPKDLRNYQDYFKYPTQIQIQAFNVTNPNENTLFCYPIDQSLEVDTCPACEEHHSIEKILTKSLKKIKDEFPDGLKTGSVQRVDSLPGKKDVLIFCTSHWGSDCDKLIHASLENCIFASNEFDAVQIVLPGVHGISKFPKKYYAQAVFKELDSLLDTKKVHRQKRITFIIRSPEYRECFERELQKRHPEKVEPISGIKHFINTYIWTFKSNENKTSIWKTEANAIPVTFVSMSYTDYLDASSELELELSRLLNKNTEILELNQEQTMKFEKIIKNPQEIYVTVVLEKHFIESAKRSTLSIQGLSDVFVQKFKKEMILALKIETAFQKHLKTGLEQPFIQCNKETSGAHNIKLQYPEQAARSCSYLSETSENNNPQKGVISTRTDIKTSSTTNSSFQWKFHIGDRTDSEFCDFEPSLNTLIEKSYVQGMVALTIKEFPPFKEISFIALTADDGDRKRPIIRYEVLQNVKGKLSTPLAWMPMQINTWKLFEINSWQPEYDNVKKMLDSSFISSGYKITIKSVQRIQNINLFNRFEIKKAQMKDAGSSFVWHRVSSGMINLVCQYGFHPKFSAMPDGSHLGDGVLFYFDAKDCVESKDVFYGLSNPIYLISCAVLLGRTSNGQKGLRSPPFYNSKGTEFDSVMTTKECMIFSDSQAYPCHLVTITCRKNILETKL